jgi:tripartite-type tricarboxylate transporter receptor subunit TctC
MTGADSMIAANYVYNKAEPDGLTIGSFNRGLLFAQLLGSQGVRFDLRKFAWIGSAASEGSVLVTRSDMPYKTIQDLINATEPIILGNTGPADSGGVFANLVANALGIKMKMVTYPSSAAVMRAVEGKEVYGRGGSYSSLLRFIQRNLVRPVIRGRVVEEGMENLPMDEDLVSDQKWKRLLALRSMPDVVERPYVARPNTPESVMTIPRGAFAEVIADPELKADARKVNMTLNYTTAEETTKILTEFFSQPPEIVSEAAKFIKF